MEVADFLVIGMGAAGCAAALRAADLGLDVLIVSHLSKPEEESNTSWAQGGIVYRAEGESPEDLVNDIVRAGRHICYLPAVRLLAERGPEIVEQLLLERCLIEFDREPDGNFHRIKEGGHSRERIIHIADSTGKTIAEKLIDEVKKNPKIKVINSATAIDLIMLGYHTKQKTDIYKPPRCLGAYVLLIEKRKVLPLLARETLLATGGLGQVYLHTTNPPKARGDGIAMAYRVGARVINLEFIQFHPTALYVQNAPRYLISEAMRGEGARLLNPDGQPFMARYHPDGELAPRDIVARAIHQEMLHNNYPCVFLDISHKPADWVRKRFPHITELCARYNIDITKEPIPVVPAAHYSCGGIAVDLEARTNVDGLLAAGEVSCTGIHGANRLASTSLLEAITWGYLAAESVAANLDKHSIPSPSQILDWEMETDPTDPALISQDWLTIKYTMWNYVGLVRSTRRLNRALKILRELQYEIETFYRCSFPSDELIGLRNGVQTALAITHAAFRNRQSIGTHYRIA